MPPHYTNRRVACPVTGASYRVERRSEPPPKHRPLRTEGGLAGLGSLCFLLQDCDRQ